MQPNRTTPKVKWLEAAKSASGTRLRQMVSSGCYLEETGKHNRTALLIAARAGNASGMDALLDMGANPLAVDVYNEGLLHAVAYNTNPRCLDLGLAQGLDLDHCDNFNRTALERESMERQDPGRVRQFLDAGADPNAAHQRPLAVAAAKNSTLLMQLLVERGATLDYRFDANQPHAWDKASALHDAARAGADEGVSWLLDRGVAVDGVDGEGATALMAACMRATDRHENTINLLLEAGADPLHRNFDGKNCIEVGNWHQVSKDKILVLLRSYSQAGQMHAQAPKTLCGAGRRL